MTRACLDSNVLAAAFVARGLCAEVLRLVLVEHDLIVPEVVATELRRVLVDKLQADAGAMDAVEAVLERCEIIPRGFAPCPVPVRDPDDERVLADAIAGAAEILVTEDADLLVVAGASPLRILSPRAFLTLLRESRR